MSDTKLYKVTLSTYREPTRIYVEADSKEEARARMKMNPEYLKRGYGPNQSDISNIREAPEWKFLMKKQDGGD